MGRVKQLEELIKRHKVLYYQGTPEIADEAYDHLEEELRRLDPENAALALVGSAPKGPQKVQHERKMLSLDKTYLLEDLHSWADKRDLVSSLKIDGVSCSLIYEQGVLKVAKTRGDGSFGEDILLKVNWMETIPKKIAEQGRIEIRGEMYCPQEDFLLLAQEMEEKKLERPSSPRNIVAGLMGRKDRLELCRHLRFFAFELLLQQESYKCEWDKMSKLGELGFELPEVHLLKEGAGLEEVLDKTRHHMNAGVFQIDGVVFTYNELALHRELGATSHHPRYKLAFKFAGELKETTIEEIEWSVSRRGVLTPVALVTEVELSGARISRVTLHNYGLVKLMKLKKGDVIEIIRSGEVIPKFNRVVKENEAGDVDEGIPTACPVCGGKVGPDQIRLYCLNEKCPGRNREDILNYIRKIGIEEISSKRLDEMIKKGLVKDVPDLYKLSVEDFLTLEKVKEKLANKFYETIEKSKKVGIKTFLGAIGLKGGAYNKCEKVVDAGFNTLEKIKALTVEDLVEVESFAEKSAEEWLASLKKKWPMVEKLLKWGVEVRPEKSISSKKSRAMVGKKLCITGALSRPRPEIEKMIKAAGGAMTSSVSKKTDYLVTNEVDSKSSKFVMAKKLNIPILAEEELLQLLGPIGPENELENKE